MPKNNMLGLIKKVELCAGHRPVKLEPDWLRQDCRRHENIDIQCDVWEVPSLLVDRLPLQEIYSKNFLEHLSVTEGKFFIRMCWNMLGPGGKLTLEVPNMSWLIEKYVNHGYDDDEDFLAFFFGGGGDEWWNMHKTMYTVDLMRKRLIEGGFTWNKVKVWEEGYPLFGEAVK